MGRDCVIGVDIGTLGTKAALFRLAGECLAESFVASDLHRPRAGVVEEDPEQQLASVCKAVRSCVAQSDIAPQSVAALAIDGQMAGVIGVDRDGRNITPYDSWLDTRCSEYIGIMGQKAGETVLRRSGNAPSINHGPKMLWWKNEHPETYKRITAFVQPGGYAAMRLCGLPGTEAFIDHTYLHFSGFADTQQGAWDRELCRLFDFDIEKLPKIVDPPQTVGTISGSAASSCGLVEGTPVAAGCGDTAASFLSCGAVSEGVCVDVAGTASVFAATTAKFRPDLPNRMLGIGRSCVPGLWHPYAYINGGGMNLEWFRTCIAGGAALEELDREAQSVAPEEVPLFVPHMEGRVSPGRPYLKGAWAELSWKCSRAHLYRSLLEAVALEYGIYCGVLRDLYPDGKLEHVRVTGGGARSALWNSIKADVLGMPMLEITHGHGAPMGSAMIAALSAGAFSSLPAAAETWVTTGRETKPDETVRAHYERRLGRYRRLLEAIDFYSKESS